MINRIFLDSSSSNKVIKERQPIHIVFMISFYWHKIKY